MVDQRRKDRNWIVSDDGVNSRSVEHTQIAVLMDIRDAIKEQTVATREVRQLLTCYRIPRALDAMHELGVEARRRKRIAADARKRANARAGRT